LFAERRHYAKIVFKKGQVYVGRLKNETKAVEKKACVNRRLSPNIPDFLTELPAVYSPIMFYAIFAVWKLTHKTYD
jgi:hypothetical protein